MKLPLCEHLTDELLRDSTVLIEQIHPRVTVTLGPADTQIQSLGHP